MSRVTVFLLTAAVAAASLRGETVPALEGLFADSGSPAPVVREVNKTVLRHLEEMVRTDPALLPLHRQISRRISGTAEAAGDTPFAQFVIFRHYCILSETKLLNPAVFAAWALRTKPSPYLAAGWADALLATGDNPRLVLALLNTYGNAATPNIAVLRARALMRLGRELDALHAVLEVFNPGSRHALPDPVLFALVGDICYANGLRREALLAWRKALRAYDAYVNDPDLDLPIEDHCLLFDFTIGPTRRKYRALRTLLK